MLCNLIEQFQFTTSHIQTNIKMILNQITSERTMRNLKLAFSDSEEEQSEINKHINNQKRNYDDQNQLNNTLNESSQKITEGQQSDAKQNQQITKQNSLKQHGNNQDFFSSLINHKHASNKVNDHKNIFNNKRHSLSSPFIKEKHNQKVNHYPYALKWQSQFKNKRRDQQKHKKRIQLLNSSGVMQDLQLIKFDNCIKRSNTATSDTVQEENIQPEPDNIFSDGHKQSQLDKDVFIETFQNHESMLQIPKMRFHQIRQIQFDSQSQQTVQDGQKAEQEVQKQQQSEHEQQQQDSNIQAKQNEHISLFSDEFRTQEYIKMRDEFFNILLSKKSLLESLYFVSQKTSESTPRQLQTTKYSQNIRRLLTTEIPINNVFEFQVHVYKDLFKTQYQLWMNEYSQIPEDEQKTLLASAYNESFHIDKSTFVVEQVNQNNQRQFIAQLESNFVRDFYILNGYRSEKNAATDTNSTNIYGQCNVVQQLLNVSLNINRTAYLSNIETYQQRQNRQTPTHFEVNKHNINLQQQYQKEKYTQSLNQNSISKLKTSSSNKFSAEFYQKFGVRESNKTLLMENSNNNHHVLFIGKIASKRYKLMVGQGLSPLQAFGILITHVENN